MSEFDFGYFQKNLIRKNLFKKRTLLNKIKAWDLGKEYYDGNRPNGYGGFNYDGRWHKILPGIIKKYPFLMLLQHRKRF